MSILDAKPRRKGTAKATKRATARRKSVVAKPEAAAEVVAGDNTGAVGAAVEPVVETNSQPQPELTIPLSELSTHQTEGISDAPDVTDAKPAELADINMDSPMWTPRSEVAEPKVEEPTAKVEDSAPKAEVTSPVQEASSEKDEILSYEPELMDEPVRRKINADLYKWTPDMSSVLQYEKLHRRPATPKERAKRWGAVAAGLTDLFLVISDMIGAKEGMVAKRPVSAYGEYVANYNRERALYDKEINDYNRGMMAAEAADDKYKSQLRREQAKAEQDADDDYAKEMRDTRKFNAGAVNAAKRAKARAANDRANAAIKHGNAKELTKLRASYRSSGRSGGGKKTDWQQRNEDIEFIRQYDKDFEGRDRYYEKMTNGQIHAYRMRLQEQHRNKK